MTLYTVLTHIVLWLYVCCSRSPPTNCQFSIEVFGAGYNGSKKAALHRDFRFEDDVDKGKWVLHAEQNLFMFRNASDTSGCTLYSTHAPCLQCSGLIREMQVKKVFFLEGYRGKPDLDVKLCSHYTEHKEATHYRLSQAILDIKNNQSA
jgi:deoxycytidylate deaminase